MENSDEVRIQHYFISLVEQVAKPLFVDSCEEARSYGLDCNVDLNLDEDGHPRLRLEVGEPGGEKSHYSLLAIPGERVIHRQYLAGAQEWHSLPAELASINPMVLDSELAVFFRRAFDLRLEGPERRHPAGFW
ncbi:hypothetical protein [Pseudomonas aeruginosa]|uniref:hypothetical protein n=1 Tax=Pseudomonas aeruginosa TaxID=287 RepID=UPI00106BF0F0|nr:hypothetical protein [Pseudomonas aeruginosa]